MRRIQATKKPRILCDECGDEIVGTDKVEILIRKTDGRKIDTKTYSFCGNCGGFVALDVDDLICSQAGGR